MMNKVSDWRLVLARSAGPPLVAAAVLALSAASWSQWAAHVFFLVLLVPVTILTINRVFGGWAALTLGTVVVTLTSWLAVGHPPTTLVSPLGRSAAWVSGRGAGPTPLALTTLVISLESSMGADRACRRPYLPRRSR